MDIVYINTLGSGFSFSSCQPKIPGHLPLFSAATSDLYFVPKKYIPKSINPLPAMPPSNHPREIKSLDDLDTVLSNIQDLESDIDSQIVPDEILPTWKERMYNQCLDWIVSTWSKLKDAEDLDVFKEQYEQTRIEAALGTLRSIESKIQTAFDESTEQQELQDSSSD
ncbi:hypothetical protein F4811DRAFT_178817 [Daldinia bambusicola]|nr:hypothetical protein F4811DRAFT_178817 [Daldinia bambusicola]